MKIKDLETVSQILDEVGAKYFLEYGTALGAYRDKDFIEGDDIDIGVFGKEHYDKIRDRLIQEGFKIKSPTAYLAISRHTEVDIHFYEEQHNCFQCYIKKQKPYLFFPKRFKELTPIMFQGKEYKTLSPIEDYLEWVYGDWKIKSNKRANHNWQTKIV